MALRTSPRSSASPCVSPADPDRLGRRVLLPARHRRPVRLARAGRRAVGGPTGGLAVRRCSCRAVVGFGVLLRSRGRPRHVLLVLGADQRGVRAQLAVLDGHEAARAGHLRGAEPLPLVRQRLDASALGFELVELVFERVGGVVAGRVGLLFPLLAVLLEGVLDLGDPLLDAVERGLLPGRGAGGLAPEAAVGVGGVPLQLEVGLGPLPALGPQLRGGLLELPARQAVDDRGVDQDDAVVVVLGEQVAVGCGPPRRGRRRARRSARGCCRRAGCRGPARCGSSPRGAGGSCP